MVPSLPSLPVTSPLRSPFQAGREVWSRAVGELGGREIHATTLRSAILRRGIERFEQVRRRGFELPQALCAALASDHWRPFSTAVSAERPSPDGSTKLAVLLHDGHHVECVHMPGGRSASLCISTQVGCPIGCRFCASGLGGLVRNLEAWEIVEQCAHARRHGHYDRIVVMGIGEPLMNLSQLLPALDVITTELPMDPRRVTVSTVGPPARVEELRRSGSRYSLALSLHAPDDALRGELVPSMAGIRVADVVEAARAYVAEAGGRLQVEYVVLEGVNDDDARVDAVLELFGAMDSLGPDGVYVNFIPWNPVPELPFRRPSVERLHQMVRRCRERGLLATARFSKGRAADAACGQLRRDLGAAKA